MIELKYRPNRRQPLLILLCLFFAVLIGVVLYNSFATSVKANAFYAVFLDNGQVYFGQIKNQTVNEIRLERVYYLKASTDLSKDIKEIPNAELSLVKLGSEIYKPKDRMIINREHVLFLEEMAEDSDIMQAINKYEDPR